MLKLFVILIAMSVSINALALNCVVCRKQIRGKYLLVNDKAYCSQKCLDSTIPVCAKCGKSLRKGYYKRGDQLYCADCISSTWPKCSGCGKASKSGTVFRSTRDMFFCPECSQLPKCFSCLVPAYRSKQLDDGRTICLECSKTSVHDMDEAEELFNTVRATMARAFNLDTNHRIHLRMIDLPAMQRRSPGYAHGIELGLFVYDATIKTVITNRLTLGGNKEEKTTYRENVSYTIFFLTETPRKKLIEVFAHELGHDFLQEYYPGIKSLKVKEGFCELCAYLANIEFGQPEMNTRIKHNPDPIYGGGFRMMYDLYQQDGLSMVRRFLRQNSN
jgi:hypothetical protein